MVMMESMVPFLFLTAITACFLLSCASADLEQIPVNPDADIPDTVFVTGIEYPDGYDWGISEPAPWNAACGPYEMDDGIVPTADNGILFMMADGHRVTSLRTGAEYEVSSEPGRHRCIDGHLYTDYATGNETVIKKDGAELFRYEDSERLSSFIVIDGSIYTLGEVAGYGQDAVINLRKINLRKDGRIIYSTAADRIVTPLHSDGGMLIFSFLKEGLCYLYENGETRTLEIMDTADTVLLAGVYDGQMKCVMRLKDGGCHALYDGVEIFPLQTYKFDRLDHVRMLENDDALTVYGELNYSYDRLRSPFVWNQDGTVRHSFGEYKMSFCTFAHESDIYCFVGYQEYSPSITCYKNGRRLYFYGRGLTVTAEPAAAVSGGRLYFLFSERHGKRKPCIAVDSDVTEYDFNGYFTGIYVS